jgi:K+-sensing histidine kinase KdpD
MRNKQIFAWKGWRPILGVLLCCSIASATTFAFRDFASKASLPLVFVVVVTVVARRLGSLAGVLGSCASALLFAFLLFPPIGSLHIADVQQRTNLGWFLVAGISFSFLFAGEPSRKQQKTEASRDPE